MVALLALHFALASAHAETVVPAPASTLAVPVVPEMYDRLEPGTTDDEAAIHSAQSAPIAVNGPAFEEEATQRQRDTKPRALGKSSR